jgi:hypothetical protein
MRVSLGLFTNLHLKSYYFNWPNLALYYEVN